MKQKSISISNTTISYKIAGMGQPVILLHGFGEDSNIWNEQIVFLKKKYQIIIPDIPGSGASQLTVDVSMDGIAEAVKQIAIAEDIDSFILIGHSMGGYATLAFAEKYTGMLKGFGLFHSSAYGDSEEKKATRKKGIEFINEHGANEFLQTVIPNLFSEKTKTENSGLITSFIKALPGFSKNALIAYYEAMMQRPDRTDLLSQTKLPVLFIIGEHDKAVAFEDSLKQSSMPQVAYIHILHNSGHMGMLEETEKSNHALQDYLDAVLKN